MVLKQVNYIFGIQVIGKWPSIRITYVEYLWTILPAFLSTTDFYYIQKL